MNLTLEDIENVQKQIDELKAKFNKQDKLELPSKGFMFTQICVNNKRINIGRFGTAEDAYDKYVIDNNLEHTTNGRIEL